MKRRVASCLITSGVLLGYAASAGAQGSEWLAQGELLLDPIEVAADRPGSLTQPDAEAAREALRQVPGNTSLITTEDVRKGRVGSIEDILDRSPSVYIQSRFGGSEQRLSIRGSGLTQTFESRGVRLLRNGLPLNEADGFTRNQLVDPLIIQHAEVYPGANALTYGAATLGGAINLVTPTGYTADRFTAHLEGGSDAWFRGQAAAGGVWEGTGLDGYASLSGLHQNGFRDANDAEDTIQFYTNVGYRASERQEHRLHFTYFEQDLELPGSLTKDQVDDDPEQPNTLWQSAPAVRDFEPLLRVDWQSAFGLGADTELDLGASWQYLDMFHILPSFQFAPGAPRSQILDLERHDLSFNTRVQTLQQAFGLDQEITAGSRLAYGDGETDFLISPANSKARGPKARVEEGEAWTLELFAEDRIALRPDLHLVLGAQWAYARREARTRQLDPTEPLGGGFNGEDDYSQFNPKLGFTWQAIPEAQLFGNFSRSFEPPTIIELADVQGTDTLDAQRAWTVELGSRGRSGRLGWQLAGYYAWVDDEILIVESPPGSGEFAVSNADDTVHAGIELGLDYTQPLGLLGADRLDARVNYTFNAFRFDDDPSFGDNDLPGIPEHVLRAELAYRHASGFYLAPNIDVAAGDAFVDFANTLENDSYAIVNLRAGYDHPAGWSLFLEAENLADKNYASHTSVIADASASFGPPAVFNPGRPRSFFGGVEYRFR